MVQSKKFSDFVETTLTDNTNETVGLSGGRNARAAKVTEWTTGTRPTPPFDGLSGYNTTLKQYEYWDASLAAWVQLANNSITTAKYILQTPFSLLPNAQALSALSTGILKSATTTGILSISAPLTSIDGLTTAADEMLYLTGPNTYAITALTALARTLLSNATAASMRSTLGLGTAAVKAATDNGEPNVASTSGSFTVGHVLVAGDTLGTIVDSGSPAGTGTVTSITAGAGLTATPNPITSAGTIAFSDIADLRLLANISGGSAPASANTMTAIIDATIGNTQGNVLYRNGTVWTVLAPGTSGQLFQTKGAAANPAYTTATYPATAGTSGNVMISDGTNWISSSAAGIGSPLTTKGDLYTFSTVNARLAVGTTNGQMLQVNSATATGLAWSTATYPDTATGTGTLLRANGTNWVPTTTTFADTYLINTIPFAGSANVLAGATLTSIMDTVFGNTQGNILYRNATAWTVLAPSTSGFVLTTGGPAADPAWSANGSGTVTSITAGTGLTATASNPITTSGTISFASIADLRLLANISGGSAAPVANTMTAIIDATIGSTQGNILYRNGTVWTVLAPGTSGQLFQTKGAAANPAYTTATYPDTATGTGTILRANGTNWVASTSTFADTYAASSLLYSNGANTVTGLATANSKFLTTDASGVPSLTNAYLTTTFTPVLNINGVTTGITYSAQLGEYTQIGNLVFYKFVIVLSSKGVQAGAVTITGFPVNGSNGSGNNNMVLANAGNINLHSAYILGEITNSTTMSLFYPVTSSTRVALANTDIADNSIFGMSGFYFTS